MTIKALTLPTVVRAKGDEPEITITTGAVDREGDVIEPDGAELEDYRRNPVVGFGHFRHEALPIGSTTRIRVEPGRGLRASFKWLRGDPMADRVRNAFEQGVLRAASIGFAPLAYEPRKDGRGMRFTRWTLLEWSLVPVPANAECVRVLRSLGLPVHNDGRRDDEEVALVLADEEPGALLVDPTEIAAVVRETLGDLVARETYRAICELRGRLPDPDWTPPRRAGQPAPRPAGDDSWMPADWTAQQRAAWHLRMENQRRRETSEQQQDAVEAAARVAKRVLMEEARRHGYITLMVNPDPFAPDALREIPVLPPGAWRR